MLDEIKRQVETSLAPLLGGILEDSGKLVRQEVALARAEIRQDFGRLKDTALYLFIGGFLACSTALMMLFSLVHGLHAAFPDLPLWASFAIVTVIIAIASGIFLVIARKKAATVKGIPEQTIESIKESAEWIQRRA